MFIVLKQKHTYKEMHNLAVNFGKLLDICKRFSKEYATKREIIPVAV
jgi:hypothetical protein